MYRQFGVGLLVLAALATTLRAQSPSPLFRVLEEHVPYDFRPLTALDVDVDGDQDLICREGVLLNDGTGRFSPTPVAPTLVSFLFYSYYVARADLDGDGFDDLLVKTPTSGTGVQLAAFAATSGGLVQTSATFPVAVGQIAPIDVDGDGDDDLLVGGAPSLLPPEGTQIWENQNGTSFVPQLPLIPATGDGPSSVYVATGDYDGDGDVDAFSADLVVGTAKFFLRAGSTFAAVTTPLPRGYGFLSGAASADFDGDGKADVVLRLVNPASFPNVPVAAVEVGLRIVGGAATSTVEGSLHLAAGFAALDLNGDGAYERAFSPVLPAVPTPRPSLEIRSGPPTNAAAPSAPIYSANDGPVVNFSFDADGDGDLDLLCTRAGRTARVFYNDGAGGLYEARGDASFAVSSTSAAAVGSLADAIVGDFDGDGDVDLARAVVAGCPEAPFAVLRNDGHGRFPSSAVPTWCQNMIPGMGLAADFDGDNRADVFRISQPALSNVSFHRSLPGGGFASATVAAENGTVTDFVARDLDGDGDVDAAACFVGSNLLVRYMNDGSGNFARSAFFVPPAPTGLRIADMDGDGYPDFVLATSVGVVVIDGATLIASTAVAGSLLERAEAGDLDGDGDGDLLVDGVPYLRQAGGSFVAQPPLAFFPLPIAGPSLPQALLDVDGDGDLDALAYGSLWRNASGAFFGPEPVPFPTVGINQIAQTGFMPFYRAADFDRDGDVDLLDPTGRLIANISRHLSRGAPAAIGRVGTLDVCGPPLQPFALFASTNAYQQNPYVVPGWGNLFLVPESAVFVGAWNFDANAGFAVPFAVPDVPALVGLDLYWQAVLPVDGKITNVERARILSL